MGPIARDVLPVYAILLVVLIGATIYILTRLFKPRHGPGTLPSDTARPLELSAPAEQPYRSTQPTHSDNELEPAHPVVATEAASPILPMVSIDRAIEELEASAIVPAAPKGPYLAGVHLCRACGDPITTDAVTLEDWERVQRFWDRFEGAPRKLLQVLGIVSRDRGRELYEVHGFCPPCAQLAQPIHRSRKERLSAERVAEDRQWERVGLVDAVKESTERARKRYEEEHERSRSFSRRL